MRKNMQPPVFIYQRNKDGRWDKPQPDDYHTLITKYYEKDGSVSTSTWFFFGEKKLHSFTSEGGMLILHKHAVSEERDQYSYYPLTEVIRFDYNPPSGNFHRVNAAWVKQEFNMDYETYLEEQEKSHGIINRENLREQIAKNLGLGPNQIQIFGDNDDDADN